MKKRFLSLILTTALICILAATAFAVPTNEVVITGESVEAELVVGGTVSIPVKITQTPGLAVAQIRVNWDNTALKLVSVNYGTMQNNSSAPITDGMDSYTVSMGTYLATQNNAQTGVMFTMEFEILPSAQAGNYTVELGQGSDAFIDKDLGVYTAILTNATVTLTGSNGTPVPNPSDNPADKLPGETGALGENTDKSNPFVDVADNAYYYDAVLWAVEDGITNGTSATTFSPDTVCTRAQVVTFLWRAAGCPEAKSTVMPFSDVTEGSYYYDAVLWAVEEGITTGTSATTFSPDADCTRGQIVTFLWRSQGSENATANNPFVDVADGAYYEDAVLWAVEEAITNGTGANTFSPDADCTRGQIVTFLYRCLAE